MIELFICIAILTVFGGAVLFKSKGMVQCYRFQAQAATLKREILFSKRLAASYSADIYFVLKQTDQGLEWIRESDEPMEHIKHHFNKWHKLSCIQNFQTNEPRPEDLRIFFSGSGFIFPKEKITIESNKERLVIELI